MNCFGVFVSGPEKDLQKYSCEYANSSLSKIGGFSFGTFMGGYYTGATLLGSQFTIEVPNGSDRVLRLVGFKVDTSVSSLAGISNRAACEGFKAHPLYRKFFDSLYTISESKPLQLNGEDLAVNMTASFDSTKEILGCNGGLGLEATTGVPNRVVAMVQDPSLSPALDPSLNLKKVSSNSCIGVKFQIQDASGKPATVTSAIDAEIIETVSSLSIGTFYYPKAAPGIDICDAANQVPAVGGKIPLPFYSEAKLFNEIVLFFRPNFVTNAARVISVNSATLKGGALALNYVFGARVASKYAFYDVSNNISTVNSTSLAPANIRRDECRLGALQFLDEYSTPSKQFTSSNSPDIIRIRTVPAGTLQFFQTQANCLAGAGSSAEMLIGMAASISATGYGFFYKVAPGITGTFSFEIENKGDTPDPVIPNGGFNSTSNLWQISN